MFKFTKHAVERMQEREITETEIMAVLKKEVDIVIYPSDQDTTVDLYFGKINNKYLLVVIDRKTKNIITVRKMRTKEKVLYEEAINYEK